MQVKIFDLVDIDPGTYNDQTRMAGLYASAWNEGYTWARCGNSRACPAFRDPAMAEQWLDGYDCAAELRTIKVDQTVSADAVTC
jgi:hypothetical protein